MGSCVVNSEARSFTRAFLRGALGVERKKSEEKDSKTSRIWLAQEGFFISRDCNAEIQEEGGELRSVIITRSQKQRIKHILIFYSTFQDVHNSDLLYPVGSHFDIGTIMLEGRTRKINNKS